MRERSRAAVVVSSSLFIGVVIGGLTELATPGLSAFLGVSSVVVFGLGLAIVEGPTLISAIILSRHVSRMWVRSALQATAPFLGFFAYLVAYGLARRPPLTFPF
jgi:hypothetical protein